jgi:hypothetical protein
VTAWPKAKQQAGSGARPGWVEWHFPQPDPRLRIQILLNAGPEFDGMEGEENVSCKVLGKALSGVLTAVY